MNRKSLNRLNELNGRDRRAARSVRRHLFNLLTFLTLLTLALSARAQDGAWLFGTNVYANGQPSVGEVIRFEPLSNRVVRADGSYVRTYPIDITTDAFGSIGSNFFVGGRYRVITADGADVYTNTIPMDGLAHDWVSLGSGPFNYASSTFFPTFIGFVQLNGTNVGSRATLNLIQGSGTTLNGTNNASSNRIDVRITATGGGGGSGNIQSINGDTAGDQTFTLSHSGNTPAIVDSTPDHLLRFPYAGNGTNGFFSSNHFDRFFAHGAQIGGNSNAITALAARVTSTEGMTNIWMTFAVHSVVTQAFDARLVALEAARISLEAMTNALGVRVTAAESTSAAQTTFINNNSNAIVLIQGMSNSWLTLSVHSTVTQAFDARMVSLETFRPLPLTNNDTRPITFLAGFTNSGNGSNSGTFDVGGNFKNFGTFNNGTFASFGSGNATFNGNGNFSGTLTGATFRANTVQAGTDNSTPLATLTVSNQVGTAARPVFLASTGAIAGLMVDTNNRVGIGTNAPGFKFNVQGTMGANGLSSNASPASYIARLSSGELVESVNPAASYQGGSATLTNLSGNPIPFTNILIGSRSVRLTTNSGVVTISSTNPVVNFSGGSTGSGPVATNQLDWLLAGNGTYRCTNAGASNQVFQITNGIPGESVTVDYIGTNFTLTFTATNGSFAGEILWALNSTTNGATSVTATNTVVVVRCVETNRYSAVYAHRRR